MSLFPFAAIVDQEDVKEAIILNLINPAIGGVLIDGACGTGKSTLARGAAEFADVPFYSLPINCSEDRLIGSIDIEKTMTSGIPALEEGILHKAHGGILFADDIYLLPDNVADLLQTVVSLGEIHVERDGISDVRPCKFMVFATMNSQLGQIRSSLADHFGLYARTNSLSDGSKRLELLRRRQSFDDAPEKFREAWQLRMEIIREEIRKARELLPSVSVPTEIQDCIVKKLVQAYTEGNRADLVMYQTVRTVAAFHGRRECVVDDVDEAAYFVLPHRSKTPLPPQEEPETTNEQEQEPNQSPDKEDNRQDRGQSQPQDALPSDGQKHQSHYRNVPKIFAVGESFQVISFAHKKDRRSRKGWGRRTQTKTEAASGRYLYPTLQRRNNDLALDATIRAAAPYQTLRPRGDTAITIRTEDIREKVRQKKVSNLLVFVVDASGSMGAMDRMVEAKGAVLSLLKDSYVKRDKIAMVTFRGAEAQVVLPPTRSAERGYRLLREIQTGGKTPLNAGISKALSIMQSQLRQQPDLMPMLIIITDGKGNVSIDPDKKPVQELLELGEKVAKISQIETMVIDIERGGLMRFGIAQRLATVMKGKYCRLDELKSQAIADAVKKERER